MHQKRWPYILFCIVTVLSFFVVIFYPFKKPDTKQIKDNKTDITTLQEQLEKANLEIEVLKLESCPPEGTTTPPPGTSSVPAQEKANISQNNSSNSSRGGEGSTQQPQKVEVKAESKSESKTEETKDEEESSGGIIDDDVPILGPLL